MDDDPATRSSKSETAFVRVVAAKAARKLRVQGGPKRDVWSGLGMSGMIGGSVAGPTLLGAMLGVWLDRRYPGAHSWALMLLVFGLAIGCANAWHWMSREGEAMHDEPGDADE